MVIEYTLPIKKHTLLYNGRCQRCSDLGRTEHREGQPNETLPLKAGQHIHIDATGYYVCDSCVRDMQREGKIW